LVANTVTANTVTGSADNTIPLNIGNRENDSFTNAEFDGLIDDTRVYNRALSTSEIQALYKLGGR
jgi:hypothetical protein